MGMLLYYIEAWVEETFSVWVRRGLFSVEGGRKAATSASRHREKILVIGCLLTAA